MNESFDNKVVPGGLLLYELGLLTHSVRVISTSDFGTHLVTLQHFGFEMTRAGRFAIIGGLSTILYLSIYLSILPVPLSDELLTQLLPVVRNSSLSQIRTAFEFWARFHGGYSFLSELIPLVR